MNVTKSLCSGQSIQLPAGQSVPRPFEVFILSGLLAVHPPPWAGTTCSLDSALPDRSFSLAPALTLQAVRFSVLNPPPICSPLAIPVATLQPSSYLLTLHDRPPAQPLKGSFQNASLIQFLLVTLGTELTLLRVSSKRAVTGPTCVVSAPVYPPLHPVFLRP